MGVPRPRENTGRVDPRRRPHSAGIPWLELDGRDPSRHYVGVQTTQKSSDGQPDGEDTLIAEYEARGYRREISGKGGVRFKFNHQTPEGKPLLRHGHIIMSIGLEEKKELDEYGENGNTGMALARDLEEKIYGNGGRAIGNDLAREGRVHSGRPSSYDYVGVESEGARR